MTIHASRKVEQLTKVNYDILEWVINRMLLLNYKKEFNYDIRVYKSKTHYSYICLGEIEEPYIIYLNCDKHNINMRYVISTILHEIRHILQYTLHHTNMQSSFKSYREYYNSKEERDARRFEKLTTTVMRTYKALEETKIIFNKYQMGTTI